MNEHAIIECVRCGAYFDGAPEQQVLLFNLHDCSVTEQMWRIERADAMRRHPISSMRQTNPLSKVISFVAISLVLLFAANWALSTLPQQDWFGLLLAIAIATGAIIICIYQLLNQGGSDD